MSSALECRWRRQVVFLLLAPALWVTACSEQSSDRDPAPDPVIAAAGDIACEPGGQVTAQTCQHKATSDLLLRRELAAVLTLGDEQYVEGRLKNFQTEYGPTWGRVLSITHPAPGNHEYQSGGDGFFQYFGAAAGDPRHPYYSFEVGAWHVIALNSECPSAGGCGKGSAQERWLRSDLRAHPTRCTLAFWHIPRFSSGGHGDNVTYQTFWDDLHAAGADLILNGHDHNYERFAPQTPSGAPAADGIREFVVGTGGKNLLRLHAPKANSEVRSATFGVLELTLHPGGYDWEFVPIAAGFTDRGHTECH
ncbi:MAG: metallophosphoesterase [Jatrophihabitantaceae bacterium]